MVLYLKGVFFMSMSSDDRFALFEFSEPYSIAIDLLLFDYRMGCCFSLIMI